jgi:hypothetical protein
MDFSSYCTPARIYFFFTVLSALYEVFTNVALIKVFMGVIYSLVWTWILNWLCGKGFTWLSWFLVLFPMFLFIAGIFFILKDVKDEQKKRNR